MMNPEELKRRVEELRKSGNFDLSTEEDLAIGVMHLVNLEEHLYFTGKKTEKDEYFDMLDRIRSMRKELLEKICLKKEYYIRLESIIRYLELAALKIKRYR